MRDKKKVVRSAPKKALRQTKNTLSVGYRRLLKLADVLDVVPRDRFDMSRWTSGVGFAPGRCGTAGCAAGWGATIPEFALAGFTLDGEGGVRCEVYSGYDACEEFFGKGVPRRRIAELRELFAPDSYADHDNPRIVAKSIRAFVAEKEGA